LDYVFINEVEPSTYVEATSHPSWQETMQSKMESIQKNGIWQLVDFPKGKRPITNKWIYNIKLGANGHMEELKAHLIARDFEQENGTDYEDMFALTVKWGTIQSIVALVA
jgi:hypothetical protein